MSQSIKIIKRRVKKLIKEKITKIANKKRKKKHKHGRGIKTEKSVNNIHDVGPISRP